eukprot:1058641-Lingulodinium_polyedra.AAC.1
MISFRPARSAVNPSMAGWLFLRAWVGNNAGRGTLICRMSPPIKDPSCLGAASPLQGAGELIDACHALQPAGKQGCCME